MTQYEYLEWIDNAVASLKSEQACAFALACCERRWSMCQHSSRQEIVESNLRLALDTLWECLVGHRMFPSTLASSCKSYSLDEFPRGCFTSTMVFYLLNQTYDLVLAFSQNKLDYASAPPTQNIDDLDRLLARFENADVELRGHEIPRVYELLQLEKRRQQRDYQFIMSNGDFTELRMVVSSESLFEEVWLEDIGQ